MHKFCPNQIIFFNIINLINPNLALSFWIKNQIKEHLAYTKFSSEANQIYNQNNFEL